MHLIGDRENREKIPTCKMYQQTDWTDDSFTKFIYPPGDGENFIVRGGNFGFQKAFATRGSFGRWVQMFKKVKFSYLKNRNGGTCEYSFRYYAAYDYFELYREEES